MAPPALIYSKLPSISLRKVLVCPVLQIKAIAYVLENWSNVALVIFKYISLLRSQPPSSTIFDELKTMANISFRFAEKSRPDSYCTELSGGMQEPIPRDKMISAKYVLEDFRPDEVKAVLTLLDPRKVAIGVTCRELPKDVGGTFDMKEPIYGTEYKQIRLSDEFMKEVSPIADLFAC